MFYEVNQISNELNCKTCNQRMEKSIRSLNRDEIVDLLKNNLNLIEKKINELKFGTNNGADQIKEYCIDLRTDVQLASELAIKQINDFNDQFIKKINNYEKDCVQAFEARAKDKIEFNEFIDKLVLFYENWNIYLNELVINEKAILEANNSADQLLMDADICKINLDDFIFNRKKLKFEKNELKLKETLIGSFITENTTNKSIISSDQMKQLMKLFNYSDDIEWKLLYRATCHGFSSRSFHSKVDGKRNTLVIIKSNNSNVFGGFTREEWSGDGCYKSDPYAFIFSYINKENRPFIMNCFRPACAIYCNSEFGPTFGRSDIVIKNNSNEDNESFSNLGDSYKHPLSSYESNELLAGSFYFKTVEIEVFCLD